MNTQHSFQIASLLGNAKLDHFAMAVRSRGKTIEYLSRLGFGPFRRFDYPSQAFVYGKPSTYLLHVALVRIGPELDLEIIETEGDNEVHNRFLRERGEGIEHVAFEVQDLETSIAAFEAAGFPLILARQVGKPGSVYMDTTAFGGTITELIRKGFRPDDPTTWPWTMNQT
jgi:4-hydroxyphenylpyruvate dioxygenase-like putative hemolysin